MSRVTNYKRALRIINARTSQKARTKTAYGLSPQSHGEQGLRGYFVTQKPAGPHKQTAMHTCERMCVRVHTCVYGFITAGFLYINKRNIVVNTISYRKPAYTGHAGFL